MEETSLKLRDPGLLITDSVCVVALGSVIKHTAAMDKALWHSGLWSFPPRGFGIRVNKYE